MDMEILDLSVQRSQRMRYVVLVSCTSIDQFRSGLHVPQWAASAGIVPLHILKSLVVSMSVD